MPSGTGASNDDNDNDDTNDNANDDTNDDDNDDGTNSKSPGKPLELLLKYSSRYRYEPRIYNCSNGRFSAVNRRE